MQNRLFSILAIMLVVHVLLSMFFILNPPLLRKTRLSKIYKSYLLPGPFFSEEKIIDNYTLDVRCRTDGEWSTSLNFAKRNFKEYQGKLNLSALYRSRLEQTLYLNLLLMNKNQEPEIMKRKEFTPFLEYLSEHYLPNASDSVRLSVIHRRVIDFDVKKDSIKYLLQR